MGEARRGEDRSGGGGGGGAEERTGERLTSSEAALSTVSLKLAKVPGRGLGLGVMGSSKRQARDGGSAYWQARQHMHIHMHSGGGCLVGSRPSAPRTAWLRLSCMCVQIPRFTHHRRGCGRR